jgi:hypothetical protein
VENCLAEAGWRGYLVCRAEAIFELDASNEYLYQAADLTQTGDADE